MKLVTFFVARTKNSLAKIITDSETTTKINVRSGWVLSLILLTSAVIYKETRLCNIFKTKKVMILTNAIIKSPYKVLLNLSKRTALTWPI